MPTSVEGSGWFRVGSGTDKGAMGGSVERVRGEGRSITLQGNEGAGKVSGRFIGAERLGVLSITVRGGMMEELKGLVKEYQRGRVMGRIVTFWAGAVVGVAAFLAGYWFNG